MNSDSTYDCVVVGAGPAGLSAALTLGRARRRVLVLDSGTPRNAAAHAMHGVLGHDGLPPAQLRAKGIAELAAYGIDVRRLAAPPAAVSLIEGGIEVGGIRGRTAILATGLRDLIPAIDGFDAIYGVSAHTCPYCDGFEHADQRIGVLAGAAGGHMGRLLRQWSPAVTVFVDGSDVIGPGDEEALTAIGVPVVTEPVQRFEHDAGRLRAVVLAGGERVECDALFFHVGLEPQTALAAALGCALGEGGFIVAEPDRSTTVAGVYAAGNCTDPMQNVPMAIADGARAGVAVNMRLVDEGVLQPVARGDAC